MKTANWIRFVAVLSTLSLSACLTGREPATCGGRCGVNASCDATGTRCVCRVGWTDCNGDLMQVGGNGCECDSTCTQCNGSSGDCNPVQQGACGNDSSYCDGFTLSCRACPTGWHDCDGLGGNRCEKDRACGGVGCLPQDPSSCPSEAHYCDATGACVLCPLGYFDCDGYGSNGCEEDQACGVSGCDVGDSNACVTDGYYCALSSGLCEQCPTGTWNCDGVGDCESTTGCEIDSCDSTCTGAYECVKDFDGTCVECLRDSHCSRGVNPGTLGPKCRNKACSCDAGTSIDLDCQNHLVGERCIDAGTNGSYCGCWDGSDCLGAMRCDTDIDECFDPY